MPPEIECIASATGRSALRRVCSGECVEQRGVDCEIERGHRDDRQHHRLWDVGQRVLVLFDEENRRGPAAENAVDQLVSDDEAGEGQRCRRGSLGHWRGGRGREQDDDRDDREEQQAFDEAARLLEAGCLRAPRTS